MTPKEFGQIIAQHGGISGTRIIDPFVQDEFGVKSPNVTPIYEYAFNDGTRLRARSEADDTFSIVDWGTAKKPTQENPIFRDTERGIEMWDAEKQEWVLTKGGEKTPKLKGTPGQEELDPSGVPIGFWRADGTFHNYSEAEVKRRLAQMKEQGTLPAGIPQSALGGGGSGGAGRTVFPWEQAKDEAQTEYYRAQAEKIRQELQPQIGLLIQNHFKTIQQVQDMLASGQIKDTAQADAIIAAAEENLKAALQGTDPFTIKKTQAQQTTERAKMGQEILGERLRTGTSLANTLISTLSNNLKTLGWGLRPGETINFDPFAIARTFSDEMGGGQEVSGLAKQLLMGLQGGQQQATTQPTSMPQATGGWDQATGLPSSVVLGWKLLDQADEKARQQPQEATNG